MQLLSIGVVCVARGSNLNSKFCPVPWISLSTKPNGNLRVCCHANTSKSKGFLKSSDGQLLNLKNSQILSARNGDLAREVRRTMIQNRSHEMCTRCDSEDAQGVRSRRQYEVNKWQDQFNIKDALRLTSTDGSICADAPLLHLDIRFSNFCNLTCRMCGPTDSSGWYKEHYETISTQFEDNSEKIELQKDINTGTVTAKLDPYQWHTNENTWIELQKYIPYIKEYYFAGGEPLLIQRHYQLLEKIVELNIADQVIIEYNTNLTKLPDRVLNLWKNFKEVRVGVSLDGFQELNEFIRYPSQWHDIKENINKLDQAKGNIIPWAATTIQIYNVLGVLDLMTWIFESKFERFGQQIRMPFITPHLLHNPPYFNIRTLPISCKKKVRTEYNHYFSKMKQVDDRFANAEKIFQGYLDYMDSEDWHERYWGKFQEVNNRLDLYRKQSNISQKYFEF